MISPSQYFELLSNLKMYGTILSIINFPINLMILKSLSLLNVSLIKSLRFGFANKYGTGFDLHASFYCERLLRK